MASRCDSTLEADMWVLWLVSQGCWTVSPHSDIGALLGAVPARIQWRAIDCKWWVGPSFSFTCLTHSANQVEHFLRLQNDRCMAGAISNSFSSAVSRDHTRYSPHFTRKSLRGGVGSGVVRGECVLVGWLKGYYWWKTVWRIRELHCYIQTENIKQLRVACSEFTFTVYCVWYGNVLHWITLNSSEHMKAYCLLFVQW
jgi:hypothetical protein